ncbi:hydroxyphenylacetyl-CoA thioesterase PaaI [Cryomorphaceae bacterium]|nr:hydroxyphenylacetyl-CoA thioesterase PaaI [Cryomorphaceae bacterium]
MAEEPLHSRVVDAMYNNDAFSQWLGIRRVEDGAGKSVLEMTVRDEMTNGFDIAHGGITYSLADSALAFASNGHGRQSVSVETSISHVKPVKSGDVLRAVATERSLGNKIGIYDISITNQKDETVALFKGTVYRTGQEWDV